MANEFVIKNGFISKGDSIVSGSLSGETLNLTTTPSNDNSQTQVLVRNNTTGLVEYRDASTFSGASGSNTFVTGTTFGSNQSITRRNDGADVLILTGGTNVTLSNPSSNQIKIDVAVPSGDNFFSTAGTVTQSATTGDTAITLQIVGNSGFSPYSITGITDTFVNDFTFSSNTFTITQNDGSSFDSSLETIELGNILSAVTFNIGTSGSISATTFNGNTFSGGTYYGDGSNLTGISTDDNYVTGGTFSTNILTLNRQNGSVTVTGFTSDSNTFVTGGTYNASTVTLDFSGNTGFSPFNVDVSALKDDTNTYVTGNTYTSATNSTNQSSLSLLYQGTATGGPHSLSSEDTFITGTTFGSNQSTTTRNDGSNILKFSGGTNVTLSNPSLNQIKIDVPLLQNQFLLDIYQSGSTTLNESTYTSVGWDVQPIIGSNYSHTIGGTNITINSTGTYKITYSVSIDLTSSNQRTISRARLSVGGVEITRSGGFGYHRTNSQGEDTISKTIITPLTSSDVVTLDAIKFTTPGGTNILSTISNNSNITITKLNNG